MKEVNEVLGMFPTVKDKRQKNEAIDKRKVNETVDKRKPKMAEEGEPEEPTDDSTPEAVAAWMDKIATKISRKPNKDDIIAIYDALIKDILDLGRFQTPSLVKLMKDTFYLL